MIRALVFFSVLFALGNVISPQVRAESDPGDRFLAAYFLIQEADTAEVNNEWAAAHAKFTAALKIIDEIKASQPDWHPSLVEFRQKYCADHIAELTPKLPVAEPPKPVVTPAAEATPSPVLPSENDQITQLKGALQQARDEVHNLAAVRDQLTAQVSSMLKEPAPTGRLATKEVLDQLHAIQAANDKANAQLAEAKVAATRADELSGQLAASQKKVQELEAGRDQLSAKLQAALAKTAGTETTPQIEDLMKKNSELSAQLAAAHAEITTLRDKVLATPDATAVAAAAEAVKLRADLAQVHADLDQTKTLLTQRTQELAATRADLEKEKAENIQLVANRDELMAKLNESDRQLRAAKASTEKDNQIIQELHKENALLHQMADNQTNKTAQVKDESGGFLWFHRKPKLAPAAAPTNDITSAKSEDSRLTATLKAPAPSDSAKAAAENVRVAAAAATDVNEGSSEVRVLLGQAQAAIAAKDFAAAKTYLTTASVREPKNMTVLVNLATDLYALNQIDEAADVLRQAIGIEPNQTKTRSLLGIIQLRKGHIDDAYDELTRAVAIEPRNAEAHNYLGIVMSEKGWSAAGEQEIRRAIELKPDYADAHFNLAVIYAREKTPRLELSRYHYQKAVDLGAARDLPLEGLLKSGAVAETPKAKASETLP